MQVFFQIFLKNIIKVKYCKFSGDFLRKIPSAIAFCAEFSQISATVLTFFELCARIGLELGSEKLFKEFSMNVSALKSQAKLQIKGKIGILFLITLIIGAISTLVSIIPVAGSIALIIVAPAFTLSVTRVYLLLIRGIDPEAKDAFSGLDDFWSAFKVSLLVGLYTYLWSLLFIIPGIIKGISYSMSMYILAEDKGKSARACIEESKAMTEGHKMELFTLSLSFIGWYLLGIVTFGTAYIWVIPYISATFANAYDSLKPVVVQPSDDVDTNQGEAANQGEDAEPERVIPEFA